MYSLAFFKLKLLTGVTVGKKEIHINNKTIKLIAIFRIDNIPLAITCFFNSAKYRAAQEYLPWSEDTNYRNSVTLF